MSIKKEAARLQSLGYQIIEVRGKHPIESDWSKWSKVEREAPIKLRAISTGFGLVLGPASGVIAVDIDLDSPETIDKVLVLAPTNFAKFGKKGITLFYAYAEHIKSTSILGFLDILSVGRQTVMPPSIHPVTGLEYTYPKAKGFQKLVEKEYLPELSKSAYDEILRMFQELADKKREVKLEFGRFNKIKSMLNAAAAKRQDPVITSHEVYEYDLKYHTPPWFTDKGESNGNCENKAQALAKALSMAKGCLKFAEKNNISNEQEMIALSIQEKIKKKVQRKDLPPPTGVLKEIFDLIKKRTGQKNDDITYMAAIIVLSNMFARTYSMNDGSAYLTTLNNFFVLIFQTGGGKSTMLDAIMEFAYLDRKNNLGLKIIPKSATLQSLFSSLEENAHNICIYDEASTIFEAIKDHHTKSLGELITSCWDCANKKLIHPAYSKRAETEKEKEVKENVSVSIVAATTESKFEESATKSMLSSGFLNRFLIITKKETPPNLSRVRIDIPQITKEREEFFNKIKPKRQPVIVDVVDEKLTNLIWEDSESDANSDNPMVARRTSHIQKLTLTLSISDNPINPEPTVDTYLRAKDIYNIIFENSLALTDTIAQDNDFERDRDKTIEIVKEYGPLVFESHLRQKVSPKSRSYDAVLKSLVDSNILIKTIGKKSGHRFTYNCLCELPE